MPRDRKINLPVQERNPAAISALLIVLLVVMCLASCATRPRVGYQRDVYPVLESKCIGCHIPPDGEGYRKTGLDLTSYSALMEGTFYGPVIVPGDSRRSILNMLVEGRAGELSRVLEKNHTPMTEREIEILNLWVQQGAFNN